MKSKKIIASIYPFPFFIGMGHDTNFSLIKDNKIFSSEEGKLGAVVNSSCDRFPEKSMLSGFKYFNIEPKDVDHWVFGGYGKTPKKAARKSIVALKNISKKEIFTENNIGVKRPGTGISAAKFDFFIGRRSKNNFKAGDLIKN